jgi:hypothetical protein
VSGNSLCIRPIFLTNAAYLCRADLDTSIAEAASPSSTVPSAEVPSEEEAGVLVGLSEDGAVVVAKSSLSA